MTRDEFRHDTYVRIYDSYRRRGLSAGQAMDRATDDAEKVVAREALKNVPAWSCDPQDFEMGDLY